MSCARYRSESTVFLSQPSVTRATFIRDGGPKTEDRTGGGTGRSTVVPEMELYAHVLRAQERDDSLQFVARRRAHAHLLALDGGLHLLEFLVLDGGGDLFGRLGVERLLQLDLAAERVTAGRLDLADIQVLHGNAALDQFGLHDVEERAHAHIVVGEQRDQPLGAFELDLDLGALEVVALGDLLAGLVHRVVDLLKVDAGGDVKRSSGWHAVNLSKGGLLRLERGSSRRTPGFSRIRAFFLLFSPQKIRDFSARGPV